MVESINPSGGTANPLTLEREAKIAKHEFEVGHCRVESVMGEARTE